MGRRERRSNDPEVKARKEKYQAASVLGDVIPKAGSATPSKSGDSGGWGVGSPNAKPATGQQPAVNPFLIPKAAGLNITSQTFPNNYYVEWNLSTWRAACDQVVRMGFTASYATLVNWVYESSPFVRSLFRQIGSAVGRVPFLVVDKLGNPLPEWTEELCSKPWQKQLDKEVAFSQFWGFSGLNFDPIAGKIYKYPMQDIDPINRMLRSSTFSFFDGVKFEDTANLLFIQPSTSLEDFLGWMQPIARSFIQMNVNKNSWIAAGRRLAFPLMTVGYPQDDTAVDPSTGAQTNPYRIQAEAIAANADPTQGVVYPYTIGPKGEIVKSIEIGFDNPGTNAKAHDIYSDFNESEKNEIREMILGGTLTSDAGKSGSRALGEVQERKFDTVVEDILEFVLAYKNDEFLRKIKVFYKNFPDGAQFALNKSQQMPMEDIQALSAVVTQNGKRLSAAFFEANGIAPEFLEDAPAPDPEPPGKDPGEEDSEFRAALPTRSLFGAKKKS